MTTLWVTAKGYLLRVQSESEVALLVPVPYPMILPSDWPHCEAQASLEPSS